MKVTHYNPTQLKRRQHCNAVWSRCALLSFWQAHTKNLESSNPLNLNGTDLLKDFEACPESPPLAVDVGLFSRFVGERKRLTIESKSISLFLS